MFERIKLLNALFYTANENAVANLLVKNKKTLAIAESCTGGLISSLMTDVSGSSAFIKSNFVTYANEAKTKYLNVSPKTLEQFGAVSAQTAEEMVNGLLNETGCDYAVATTGIAGPTGGTKEKPVGLVYIGVGTKDKCTIVKYNVNPKCSRILIKYHFAKQAIKVLYNYIKDNEK